MNNTDILGEEAAVRQILENDFSATDGVFEDDTATSIRAHAFRGRTTLKKVIAPNVKRVDNYAFGWCHSLEELYLPEVETVGTGLTYQVRYSQTGEYPLVIVLPKLSSIGNTCCRQGKYTAVDFGEDLHRLPSDSFYACTVDAVILRSKTLVVAATKDAVGGIKNLYVPSALVPEYATATNWSANASNRTVNAIEGSQYEHYYANGVEIV